MTILVRGLGVPVLPGVGVVGTARRAAARRGTGGGGPVEFGAVTGVALRGGVEGADVGKEMLLGVMGRFIGLAGRAGDAGLVGVTRPSFEPSAAVVSSLTSFFGVSATGFEIDRGLTSSFKSTVSPGVFGE